MKVDLLLVDDVLKVDEDHVRDGNSKNELEEGVVTAHDVVKGVDGKVLFQTCEVDAQEVLVVQPPLGKDVYDAEDDMRGRMP